MSSPRGYGGGQRSEDRLVLELFHHIDTTVLSQEMNATRTGSGKSPLSEWRRFSSSSFFRFSFCSSRFLLLSSTSFILLHTDKDTDLTRVLQLASRGR